MGTDGSVPTVSSPALTGQLIARCPATRTWAFGQEGPWCRKRAPTGLARLGALAPTFGPTALSSG